MSLILTCPDEAELLAIAGGEPARSAILAHVEACVQCRQRLEQLRTKQAILGRVHLAGKCGPSTQPERDRGADQPSSRSSGGTRTMSGFDRTAGLARSTSHQRSVKCPRNPSNFLPPSSQ
ncbi:MAG: hypothetical protein ACLQIB_19935 [Isosphaeraceae bacterium]